MSDTITVETVTERQLAKTIDHSLLKPELDDAFIEAGCRLAAEYDVASVCVRPVDVKRAVAILDGTDVAVGTVIGFPHGSSTTASKVFEDSLLFPFALSFIGLGIIGAGLALHRNRPKLSAWMADSLPAPLKRLRPPQAGGATRLEHA